MSPNEDVENFPVRFSALKPMLLAKSQKLSSDWSGWWQAAAKYAQTHWSNQVYVSLEAYSWCNKAKLIRNAVVADNLVPDK